MSKRVWIAIVVCVLSITCSRQDRKSASTPDGRPGPTDLPPRSATIVIPPDSPQLNQFEVVIAKLAVFPEVEVIAPGRIEFNVNRISRVLLPVPGRIDQVLVQWGDPVSAGQTLFTIDSPEADAAISDFKQAQASVSQARSTLTKAKADLERTTDLFQHKAIAKKEVLISENNQALAQGALDQAEAALKRSRRRLVILGLNDDDAGSYVTVRAPLTGKVIDLSITSGEYRNDTITPVMTVANLDTVWVTSAIPENSIRFIEVGEHVQVELYAYPGEIFGARVSRIADTLDPKTRTVQVRADLANPKGKFKPEMFGRIRHSHAPRTIPVVPARAILYRSNETTVYVERRRGTFERVPVILGATSGDQIAVLAGVIPGDRVVVGGCMILAGMELR